MNGAGGNRVTGRLGRLTDSKLAPYLAALTALVIAAVFSFGIFPRISVPQHVVLDPDQHGNLAYGILKNHTFSYYPDPQPTVERGPAYPALMALVLLISNGWWPYSVQAAQCVMFALTCLMAYWVSSVLWSRRTAAFVALAVAFHPLLIWYTSRIWIETTAAFLFTSIVAASLSLALRPTAARAALLGVVLAAGSLCKGTFLIFVPLVPALLYCTMGKGHLRSLAAVFAIAVVLISPWTFRNWMLTGEFIPVHARAGFNVRVGDELVTHYPSSPFGLAKLWDVSTGEIFAAKATLSDLPRWQRELRLDAILAEQSRDVYRRNPWFLPKKIALNAWMFWTLGETKSKSAIIGLLLVPLFVLFVRTSIVVWRTGGRRTIQGVHIAMVLAYYAVHLPVEAIARYSVVLLPTMLVYALAPVVELAGRRAVAESERGGRRGIL
jgi:4-amino-4-deoxy-L-arabinose transferase-like glycosyltransferase